MRVSRHFLVTTYLVLVCILHIATDSPSRATLRCMCMEVMVPRRQDLVVGERNNAEMFLLQYIQDMAAEPGA